MYVADRITVEADKMFGKPCIRGLRFPVADVLEIIASGLTWEEIAADYPDLEPEDLPAALHYAAHRLRERLALPAMSMAAE